VESALHRENIDATELAEDQFAAMPFDGGYGKIRDILIGELVSVSNFGS
jgi:hypothetical protein